MEFPDLGAHCYEKSCNRLDFLPMKCDSCSYIFCKDHIFYSNHSCVNSYKKDIQVPVCPLCNQPVPSKRGETPDIAVGQHIDDDCSSQSAIDKRRVYTNKCSLKKCKQRELIPVMCNSCRKNYCLKHRHPADHKCQEAIDAGRPLSHAGAAAINRVQNTKSNTQSSIRNFFNRVPSLSSVGHSSHHPTRNLQAGMSEDEALARALQASMVDSRHVKSEPKNLQEEEDRLLAEALVASEREADGCSQSTQNKDKSCSIS